MFYTPLKPTRRTQSFGENKACISTDGNNTVISCDGNNPPEGYRSVYGSHGHLGVDFKAYHGQEVYAAHGGVVDEIDTNPRTGLDVRIVSRIAGVKYRHIYEHLLGYQPKVGDTIKTGQLIGWADNTGYSSGNHLHFQLEQWEERSKRWVPIDPEPLLSPIFAKDILKMYNKILFLKEQVALLADHVADYLRRNNK